MRYSSQKNVGTKGFLQEKLKEADYAYFFDVCLYAWLIKVNSTNRAFKMLNNIR